MEFAMEQTEINHKSFYIALRSGYRNKTCDIIYE